MIAPTPTPPPPTCTLHRGDCLKRLSAMPAGSVDLVVGSPPYERARTYGIGYDLTDEAWVAWARERFRACARVSRGLVCWVVAGTTDRYSYSCTPELLTADLKRGGLFMRPPRLYKRFGIPGSGGPDDLRRDFEFIIIGSAHRKRLDWSDNTAWGHPPRFPPGGAMSHRNADGVRKNEHASAACKDRMGDGRVYRPRPAERRADGSRQIREYKPPKLSNPGNIYDPLADWRAGKIPAERAMEAVSVMLDGGAHADGLRYDPVIDCGAVGGGRMGHDLAHENEAPFPLTIAERLVLEHCPPGGTVLDPFLGSGTTMHAALLHGRSAIGIDCRASQLKLTERRLREVGLWPEMHTHLERTHQ